VAALGAGRSGTQRAPSPRHPTIETPQPVHDTLPEGTEIELLPLDPGDWLDQDDRAALHRALLASQEDIEGGRLVDAEEVLRELQMS
jgi:hypothetical protein